MGSCVHPDTGDDEFSTKFYWQAPWSTAPGGTNPLIYMFGESWPWNLSGDSNDWNNTALIGTPTPSAKLKQITARRATARQKRRLMDWRVEHDGPFEKVFRGEDPIVGPLNDPRLSIPCSRHFRRSERWGRTGVRAERELRALRVPRAW